MEIKVENWIWQHFNCDSNTIQEIIPSIWTILGFWNHFKSTSSWWQRIKGREPWTMTMFPKKRDIFFHSYFIFLTSMASRWEYLLLFLHIFSFHLKSLSWAQWNISSSPFTFSRYIHKCIRSITWQHCADLPELQTNLRKVLSWRRPLLGPFPDWKRLLRILVSVAS